MNEKQKAFLRVVVGQKASDNFSKKIEELTEEAKAKETAIALLEKGIPPETIAECVKLPLEKVLELQKGILVVNEGI